MANRDGRVPPPAPARPGERLLLFVACLLPSLVTLIYFVGLARAATGWQWLAYVLGKGVLFLLPLIWMLWFLRQGLPLRPGPACWLGWGGLFGLFVAAAMVVGFQFWLRDLPSGHVLAAAIRTKVAGLGITTPTRYAMLLLFYCLVHAFFEEYYWRWFVFGRLRVYVGTGMSIFLSSMAFMGHHVLVLGHLLGWDRPLAYALSLAVALGGGFWAWLYHRSGTLIPSWFSHAVVDAGILGLGYFLVASALKS